MVEGHTALITSILFSVNGVQLISSSHDGLRTASVRLWNVETGLQLNSFVGHKDAVY